MMRLIVHTARRECQRMIHDPIYLVCILCPAIACYLLFTSLMSDGLPVKLPAGMVDRDGSSMSRNITRALDAYQYTDIVGHYPTAHKAFETMRQGRIYGFYYLPEGMEADALDGRQPTVSFYLNYAYLIAGSLLYKDMRTMAELTDASVAEAQLSARGTEEWQVKPVLQPIAIDTHPLDNPWLNYSVYLNNTLLPGVLLLTVMLVTVYSIGTEMKYRTAGQWLQQNGGRILPALAGKLLPQTLLFSLMAMLYVSVLYGYLHFPLNGGLLPMMSASILAVSATQAFGVFLFCLFPWMRMAMSAASLWGVLSFSISGFSFPAMAMNPALQALNHLFPLRHYFLIYAGSALNGAPFSDVLPSFLALTIFLLLPLLFLKRLKRKLLTYVYME